MKTYNTIIKNLIFLSSDVVEVTFKIEDNQKMDFTPGQFILVDVSVEENIKRAYSVLEYNRETNEIKIAVKKVENGKATTIIFNDFNIGQNVKITGALGNELIVDSFDDDIILVATGIGITPILCILNYLVNSNFKRNIKFLYGARTLDELFYKSDIEDVISKNDNIEFIPVLSRENVEGIKNGYVTDVIKSLDLKDKKIYMCSSRSVASSFKNTLIELCFNLDNFNCESA